jgi:DNA polymerase III delta prime subunit
MKFVLLNGPPGCGKDTATSQLVPYLNFVHLKFAAPLKRMVCGLLQCSMSELEATKDIPNRTLRYENYTTQRDDTPRQLLIALSEELLKSRYGNSYFGTALWTEATASSGELFIVSDCGFESEVGRLIYSAGPSNCLLIQIHRQGCNFDNDSRSYLSDKLCKTLSIPNNMTPHDLTMRVLSAIIRNFPEIPLLREPDWIKQ